MLFRGIANGQANGLSYARNNRIIGFKPKTAGLNPSLSLFSTAENA
jgi:hypothetical protein